jgi:ComF family protein
MKTISLRKIRSVDPADRGSGGRRAWLRHASEAICGWIVPPACLACGVALSGHDAICARCWGRIAFIRPPLCDRLGIPLPFGGGGGPLISAAAAADPPVYDRARAVAVFEHTGVLQQLVHGLKYADRHDARRLFGRWLAEAGSDLLPGADVIVPVPLARLRLMRRQFNQSALLAKEIARQTGIDWSPAVLVKTRATPAQVGLTREQRKLNVRGVFHVPDRQRQSVANRNVLLVDDVITTGATVASAARALKSAGALRVDVLALGLVADGGAVTL